MQAGARFGDILEQKLENRAGTWPMAAGPQFDPRVPVVNPLFLQVGAVPTFSADVARSTACFIYAVQGLPSAPRQPRPRRRLSAGQRGALDCLRELGAGSLPDDF